MRAMRVLTLVFALLLIVAMGVILSFWQEVKDLQARLDAAIAHSTALEQQLQETQGELERRPSAPQPQAAPRLGKVGLLLPGTPNDLGFNYQGLLGVQLIQRELGAEFSLVENVTPADATSLFPQFAEQGFRLVFGQGGQFQSAAHDAAVEHPETVFISNNFTDAQAEFAPNQGAIVIELEESFYLGGILAASLSKSGIGLAVGGIELPSLVIPFQAFAAGARSVNPDFRLLITFIGNFSDAAAALEATRAGIAQGADVILADADEANSGLFQAIQGTSVKVFPAIADLSNLAPEHVLVSMVADAPQAYLAVARAVADGTFSGGLIALGLAEGATGLVYNPALEDQIPQEALDRVAAAQAAILAGTLEIPRQVP